MSMSKTAAIAAARKAVSMPIRRSSTDYIVCGPYRDAHIDGPSTEAQCNSYQAALAVRARWVASVALHLMGAASDVYTYMRWLDSAERDGGSAESMVERGLRMAAAQ